VLDAVAYDTTRIVVAAVQAGGDDRDVIRDQLSQVELIGPVTGATGFNAERTVDRSLLILTVGDQGIVPWQPPEALADPLSPSGEDPPPAPTP